MNLPPRSDRYTTGEMCLGALVMLLFWGGIAWIIVATSEKPKEDPVYPYIVPQEDVDVLRKDGSDEIWRVRNRP